MILGIARHRARVECVVACAAWALIVPATLSACRCPNTFRGVGDGDRLRTTVVANDTARALGASVGCGDLGDLSAGAALDSVATVQNADTSACFAVLTIRPTSLSTATLSEGSNGTTTVSLADGCQGQFDVYFQSASDTSSLLDDDRDGGLPPWWLMRRFTPTSDPALCFGDATPEVPCLDAFIADNARLDD